MEGSLQLSARSVPEFLRFQPVILVCLHRGAYLQSREPLVEFRNVAKTYDGEVNVLENLNLEIAKGEFVTLLGASGSGKTTALMILAGFEPATQGDIFLNGRRLNDVPAYKRNMGVVFQSYALFPHQTVAQNVAYPLKHRKVPKAERIDRVADALKMVDLEAFGTRLPSQLSGGQQQRVALARALVFEPELVLMDEPLGALDKNLREQMQLELKRLHDQLGMTVVYVTHDQSEALTMSDRIAVFDRGKILQIGTPTEIYERPSSSFVANFVGENNNLRGKVRSVNRKQVVVTLADGSSVKALNPLKFKAGDEVNVVIRPEHMIPGKAAGENRNQLAGRIRDIIYYGDHHRLEIDLELVGLITLKTHLGDEIRVSNGSSVNVSWNAGHSIALDAQTSPAQVP